jgi:hypothetical protein
MKDSVKDTLDIWYGRMIQELDKLPDKIEEMSARCFSLLG